MVVAIANLVHQTATTTGTGNFTLTAVNGKQSFNGAFGNGATLDVFYYFISHRSAAEWEIGTGHMSNSTTLVRDTVLASTNGGSLVNFAAGTKDVTCDLPADKQVSPWEYITQTPFTVTANMQFTGLGSPYIGYKFVLLGVVGASGGFDLYMQYGTGAGPTWQTTNNHTYQAVEVNNTPTVSGATGTDNAEWKLMDSIDADGGESTNGWVEVYIGDADENAHFTSMMHNLTGASPKSRFTAGSVGSTGAITAIRFNLESGTNFAANGKIVVYGIRGS